MPPPLIGPWTVRVHAVRPFTIHGDVYYELHVTEAAAGETTSGSVVRLPEHALPGAAPAPGETLTLTFLMGQVTSAKRA